MSTPILPAKINAANHDPSYTHSRQCIFEPAVRLEGIDLMKLPRQIGHPCWHYGDQDEVFAGATACEIENRFFLRGDLGPLEGASAFGTGRRAATSPRATAPDCLVQVMVCRGEVVVTLPRCCSCCPRQNLTNFLVTLDRLFYCESCTHQWIAFLVPTLVGDYRLLGFAVGSKFRLMGFCVVCWVSVVGAFVR